MTATPTPLRELPAKWDATAAIKDYAAAEADSVGMPDAATNGEIRATQLRECANELRAALSARDEAGAVGRYCADMEDSLRTLHEVVGMDPTQPDTDALIARVRTLATPPARGEAGAELRAWLSDYADILNDEGRTNEAAKVRAALAAVAPAGMDGAVALIAAERQRQVSVEGWTPEHDDEHGDHALALAAAVYAVPGYEITGRSSNRLRARVMDLWPWAPEWFKPCRNADGRIRELVKAGALIAAEIERLQRAAPTPPATAGQE